MADDCDMAYRLLMDEVVRVKASVADMAAKGDSVEARAKALSDDATALRRCRKVLITAGDVDFKPGIETLDRVIDAKNKDADGLRTQLAALRAQQAQHQGQHDRYLKSAEKLKNSQPVAARVTVTPLSGRPNQVLTLNGFDFAARTVVQCIFISGPVDTAGTTVSKFLAYCDVTGLFTASYTIPVRTVRGPYHFMFSADAHKVPDVGITVT